MSDCRRVIHGRYIARGAGEGDELLTCVMCTFVLIALRVAVCSNAVSWRLVSRDEACKDIVTSAYRAPVTGPHHNVEAPGYCLRRPPVSTDIVQAHALALRHWAGHAAG